MIVRNVLMMILLVFLAAPLSSAFSASSDVYSIDSYHMGLTGNVVEGEDYSGRDTLVYQQPGNDESESDTSTFNLGWFSTPIEEEEVTEEEVTVVTFAGGAGIYFDVKILEFESPVNVGELFSFTYLIKGVGSIHDDVTVDFWIEKNGTVITSGSDVIFMGTNEEKIENASLFLPVDIKSGIYKFVVRASLLNIHGEAHREIGITVEDGIARIESLFDISFSLIDVNIESSDDLITVITFENFGTIPTTVDLTFLILDEFGNEVYREKGEITVITEEVLRKKFLGIGLSDGDYTFVLETLYGDDVFDKFEQKFTVRAIWRINFLIWIIIVLIVIIILVWWFMYKRCGDKKDGKKTKCKKRPKRKAPVKKKRKTFRKEISKVKEMGELKL